MYELDSRELDIAVAVFKNPSPIEQNSRIRLVNLDIHAPPSDPFVALGKPDLLLHFAWSGLPRYDSLQHLEKELPAHEAFLSACVHSGIKRLLVAGTCFEYGMVSGEIKEDHALNPTTKYGKAKVRLFEKMTALREKYPFDFTWARIFYLFGSDQSPNSIYSQLQAAISRGDESFDMSGGEQIRDYLCVRDAASLLVDVAIHAGDLGAVNLCSGVPIRLKDQVTSWLAESNSAMRLNLGRISYSNLEPMAFWGSRSKLDCALGSVYR